MVLFPIIITPFFQPVLETRFVNENLLARKSANADVIRRVIYKEVAVLGRLITAEPGNSSSASRLTAYFAMLQSIREGTKATYKGDPMAYLHFPVFNRFNETRREAVGIMTSVIQWKQYFDDLLPDASQGIVVVLNNTCSEPYTYELFGRKVDTRGFGDKHNPKWDKYRRDSKMDVSGFDDGSSAGVKIDQEGCEYYIHVYPSRKFHSLYVTN
jgi:hypothetical protein